MDHQLWLWIKISLLLWQTWDRHTPPNRRRRTTTRRASVRSLIEGRPVAPMKFSGTSSEDAKLWWCSFELIKNFKELTDQRALAFFPLMLKDGAMTWYLGQSTATKINWTTLQDAFKEHYFPQEINKWKQTSQVWSMKQGKEQSAI